MSEEGRPVKEHEYDVPTAHVTHIETPRLNHLFVRLVPLGRRGRLAQTIDAESCMVDFDHEGNIMGITVSWWTQEPDS